MTYSRFDGERETRGIRTVYPKENETADMYIERLANDIGKNYSVKVVTNDSLIRLSAMRSGVLRMSVKEFSDELDGVMKKIMEYIGARRCFRQRGSHRKRAQARSRALHDSFAAHRKGVRAQARARRRPAPCIPAFRK